MAAPRVLHCDQLAGFSGPVVYVGPPAAAPPAVPSAPRFASPFRRGPPLQRRRRFQELLARCPGLAEAARRELRGRSLACWCSPRPCHAEVLLAAAAPRPRRALLEPGRWAARSSLGAMATFRRVFEAAGAGGGSDPPALLTGEECLVCGEGRIVSGVCDFCGLEADPPEVPDVQPSEPRAAALPEACSPAPLPGADPAGTGPGGPGSAEPDSPPRSGGGRLALPAASADPFWLGRSPEARPPPPPPPPAPPIESLGSAHLSEPLRRAAAGLKPGALLLASARQALAEQKGTFDAETLLLVSEGLGVPVFVTDGELLTREELCERFIFADVGVAPETVFARQEVGVFAASGGGFEYVARDAGVEEGFAPALDVLRGRARVPLKVVATRVFVGREAWGAFKSVQQMMRGLVTIVAGRQATPALGPPGGPLAGLLAAFAAPTRHPALPPASPGGPSGGI